MISRNTPVISLQQQGKDTKKFIAQEKIVSKYLHEHTATMRMIEDVTGVRVANLCRYLDKSQKQASVHLLKKGICPITKRNGVAFYTSNEKLFPIVSQLKMEI